MASSQIFEIDLFLQRKEKLHERLFYQRLIILMEKLLAQSHEVCIDMATEDLCADHSIIIRFLSFSDCYAIYLRWQFAFQ